MCTTLFLQLCNNIGHGKIIYFYLNGSTNKKLKKYKMVYKEIFMKLLKTTLFNVIKVFKIYSPEIQQENIS